MDTQNDEMPQQNIEEAQKAQEKAVGETMERAGQDNSVEQAAKKERQPTNAGELSSIHNTHSIGTAGGDQREKDADSSTGAPEGRPVITTLGHEPVQPPPVEEPAIKRPPIEDEEPGKETPLHTEKEPGKE